MDSSSKVRTRATLTVKPAAAASSSNAASSDTGPKSVVRGATTPSTW